MTLKVQLGLRMIAIHLGSHLRDVILHLIFKLRKAAHDVLFESFHSLLVLSFDTVQSLPGLHGLLLLALKKLFVQKVVKVVEFFLYDLSEL